MTERRVNRSVLARGLAWSMAHGRDVRVMTAAGDVVGTVERMEPAELRGDPRSNSAASVAFTLEPGEGEPLRMHLHDVMAVRLP